MVSRHSYGSSSSTENATSTRRKLTEDISAEDLVRLVEDDLWDSVRILEENGGVEKLASFLRTDIADGINSENSEDLITREKKFGKNYITPPKQKSIFDMIWAAFHVSDELFSVLYLFKYRKIQLI